MAKELKILVIDDEQIVLDSVIKHLRNEPFIVTTSSNPHEAILLLDQTEFDIILVDLMMPKIDGLELTKKVKTRFPAIPVIIMTGYATIGTAEQATQVGAFAYIAKPFSRAELKEIVHLAANFVTNSS